MLRPTLNPERPLAPPSALEAALRQEEDKQRWVNWLFRDFFVRCPQKTNRIDHGWHT